MHLPQVVQKLHLILKPFLLRRIKNDVEKSLPKKKEIILYTPMTEMQKQFNDHLLKRTLHEYYEDNGKTNGTFHYQNNMSYQFACVVKLAIFYPCQFVWVWFSMQVPCLYH